ncbi:hypothetical protein M5K25_020813 [Dendrobium thyrsiflorum]|uniref:Uncharacterized protein n=1 Tax=Dendrobium thyrsiflorum TaxID=117978 RepID=A0ABD0UAV6_DENTH
MIEVRMTYRTLHVFKRQKLALLLRVFLLLGVAPYELPHILNQLHPISHPRKDIETMDGLRELNYPHLLPPRPQSLSSLGPKTLLASWSRSAPSGKNALQNQSVLSVDTSGAPANAISDFVRSSPPKNGWIRNNPNSFTFFHPPLPAQRRATWCAMLAPALSPARKQDEGSARWPATASIPPESMNRRVSMPSS